MPKKKKASELPPVGGVSPPRSAGPTGRYAFDEDRPCSKDGQRVWFKAHGAQAPPQSEPSTAASLGISRDDARGISQLLDDSLHLASGFSTAPDTASTGDDWDVQNPKEIIEEVKRCVHERKPWRQTLDDRILDKKHNERQDRMEKHAFHIILPDTRVRLMEDELSFRVRCSLLEVDPSEMEQPPPLRRPDKNKFRNQRMKQNPWYLKPTSWYSLKDKLRNENEKEDSNDFPYANVILNLPDEAKPDEEDTKKQMSSFQKENLEMYKAYMKGNRLPHFLQ